MKLNRDFKEFLQSLNDNGVRYLLVGAYALAIHGHPRYTKDLDIWLDPTKQNSERTITALEQFGFASLGLRAEDFLSPGQVIQLGYPPNRIDLLNALEGVEFEQCYASKIIVTIDGVAINVIDLENFKKNKRAVGRHQDLADLEKLE